ncbi:CRISPR-associated protein Cas5 [Actinoalloteichus fjordicus]|uniref:CRISPR-associated protein Cas5 n=1 Tax=Actinoalloteichus fjordicus TaxID=1612552 RepID=A0AAC9PSP2_9PSEU|nr:CRISPR-associated protein Cas5 [Actinoalloteichus fjordicus]APU15215.1 CRISPR-associated protein Cas5 [Actinoalloteichus fjordicus]
MSIPALEVTVAAPVASFRNPLYPGMQVGLPCPPPSTVGGLLAAASGSWARVPQHTRFAMAFHVEAAGKDLETFHPLAEVGVKTTPVPKDRDYLWGTALTLWLIEDLDLWAARLRRPVWPLHLGRSQDLASVRTRRVDLDEVCGEQRRAVILDHPEASGTRLRLTTAVREDRSHTRWDDYRYADPLTTEHQSPPGNRLPVGWSTDTGQGVALLPAFHPALVEARS